ASSSGAAERLHTAMAGAAANAVKSATVIRAVWHCMSGPICGRNTPACSAIAVGWSKHLPAISKRGGGRSVDEPPLTEGTGSPDQDELSLSVGVYARPRPALGKY